MTIVKTARPISTNGKIARCNRTSTSTKITATTAASAKASTANCCSHTRPRRRKPHGERVRLDGDAENAPPGVGSFDGAAALARPAR